MTPEVRRAGAADARAAAEMLDDFNREFDWPTPGPDVLAPRLEVLLDRGDVVLLLAGDPPAGLALMTFRPIVWDPAPAAMLDELYVRPPLRNRGIGTRLLARAVEEARKRGTESFEINVDEGDHDAQRFYERHGFSSVDRESGERALYFFRAIQP